MQYKQIVFTAVNRAELLEKELVPPTGTQVQVKLAVSTISSGTERANRDDIQAQLLLACAGRLDLKCLIEETHSPEEAPAVYTRLATDRTFPVVQFDWRLLHEKD